MTTTSRFMIWSATLALVAACETPLETDPTASIDAETALSTARGIELGLNGGYRSLQSGNLYSKNLLAYADLYADNLEFAGTFTTDQQVGLRNVAASSGDIFGWTVSYDGINRVNSVLAAVEKVSALTATQKAQYRGEALFIRALHYSLLLNWYGGVPIVTEPASGVGEQSQVPRNTAAEVFAQIEQDLSEASTLLTAPRNHGHATKGAADALLARVYLEDGKNGEARDRATAVINNATYQLLTSYRSIFTTKNSAEGILELQYSVNNQNSLAFWFFPQALGGRLGFSPSNDLFGFYEAGDTRRDASVGVSGTTRYGFKYYRIANGDDNVPVLRLAEMYLIRAEANARLNAASDVVLADLNRIRTRAGLAALTGPMTQAQLLTAILRERRTELAFEGHRFFDLRRYGLAMSTLNIAANKLVMPIPQAELDVNSKLVQNAGY